MRKILKNRRGKNLLFRTKQSLQCTMYCTSTYVLKVCSMLMFLKVLRRTEGLFTEQINKFYVHRNDRENNYLILAVTKLRIMLTKTRSFTSLINLKFSKNLQYRYLKRNTMSLSTGMQKQSINNKKVEDSEKLQNYF